MTFDELEFPSNEDLKHLGRQYLPGLSANIRYEDGTVCFVNARDAGEDLYQLIPTSKVPLIADGVSLFELALHLLKCSPIHPGDPDYDGARHAKEANEEI